ncbi:hypothetical protein LTR56_008259 [Elasticomyces elasticus]|nr:hypothetical protein LTR56_008259 [Elasticomyces elasticus]KAK3661822.1 hypothetical protein LTR22_007405 [Elasticomyces elasticus]KAK4924426.1 hypothetical protein LTR49_008517 [Elasticomyces elasticus]KAK5762610.1 hypothetical protein LTS12_007200 [Elasticomyces elasticus]
MTQKTEYINDLENILQAWALRGEAPALYHMMRIAAPKLMRSFEVSLRNVVDYGTSTAARARKNEVKRENVISGMLANAQSDSTTLSDSALGAQASALIVAGSGTTATTLTYAVWAVMSHADVRNKLEGEVLNLPEDYTDALLEKLPYLKAVILEALRLYGAAPGSLPRVTPSKGMQVKDSFVPAGIIMTTQAYTMHRDAAVFADPEKFNPSRFYQKEMTGLQKSAFGPFGGGTRVCLGIHLAEMELRHGLTEFIRKCGHIALSDLTTSESMEMENFFLISPKSKRCFVRAGKSEVLNS